MINKVRFYHCRKREYYIISPDGKRVFNLGLGPVTLAFVGASSGNELRRVRELKKQYGREWPVEWLKERDLPDWAEEWRKVDHELHTDINTDDKEAMRANYVPVPKDN